MRRERGEPGGFGIEEVFSLGLLAFFLPSAFFIGLAVLWSDARNAVVHVVGILWGLLPF